MPIILTALVSLVLAFNLPVFYERAKISVIESGTLLSHDERLVRVRPGLALLILSAGVLPVWFMTHSPGLTGFVLLLGCVAYIDYLTRWVPDPFIYSLLWLALSTPELDGGYPAPFLWGAAVIIAPALLLNMGSFLRRMLPVLASGDVYVLPAVGVWLSPQHAALCISLSLLSALIMSRWWLEVPFVTVLYVIFTGVILWARI